MAGANTTCEQIPSQWQTLYTQRAPAPAWDKTQGTACSGTTMAWLSNGAVSLQQCEALAQFTGTCTHPKTVAFEDGTNHNCCATAVDRTSDLHSTAMPRPCRLLHLSERPAFAPRPRLREHELCAGDEHMAEPLHREGRQQRQQRRAHLHRQDLRRKRT